MTVTILYTTRVQYGFRWVSRANYDCITASVGRRRAGKPAARGELQGEKGTETRIGYFSTDIRL